MNTVSVNAISSAAPDADADREKSEPTPPCHSRVLWGQPDEGQVHVQSCTPKLIIPSSVKRPMRPRSARGVCRNQCGGRLRARAQMPSVDRAPYGTMAYETYDGHVEINMAHACGRGHRRLRWSPPWSHEACKGCADMAMVDACGRGRCSFCGAPHGATKRVRDVDVTWWAHASARTGTFGGAPYGLWPMGRRSVRGLCQ
eukprot:5656364-Pyramimonas_sp.AAC.2